MIPLATRIRPQNLNEFVGQAHLVGPQKPLRIALEKKHQFSFILWGPPGVGKTTLGRLYANALGVPFFELSAVNAGKDDIKKVIESSVKEPPVLFIDEIHRFNKAQQDFLLPFVESGKITLVGATTENPSFEIISALLSRCHVFVLDELSSQDIKHILERTTIEMAVDAQEWLVAFANGDARQALTLLDTTASLYQEITVENLKKAAQNRSLRYDKKGEEHYNTISAFIKSMRASQADAALYYLARMVEAGEDPVFIARRMVIFASEDIGLADSHALEVAVQVFKSVEIIGYPECAINLAHGVCYLSLAQKNRDSYNAFFKAVDDVKKTGNIPIPLQIRNAPTKLMKEQGYGKGYSMYSDEDFLPNELQGRTYLKKQSIEST
jgi:putative ATPase